MTRLRKRIAERLKQAQNTAAMLDVQQDGHERGTRDARALQGLFEKRHGVGSASCRSS
jgi:2-oxoglutarate dehydrogenase E2 component (dihydrolipoamide succinyltransferase)